MQNERTFAPFVYWQLIDQKVVLLARQSRGATCDPVSECKVICELCRNACLATLDRSARGQSPLGGRTINGLMDCAALCELTAAGLKRSSSASGYVAEACAHLALRCIELLRHEADSVALAPCVASCQQCALACAAVIARWRG